MGKERSTLGDGGLAILLKHGTWREEKENDKEARWGDCHCAAMPDDLSRDSFEREEGTQHSLKNIFPR